MVLRASMSVWLGKQLQQSSLTFHLKVNYFSPSETYSCGGETETCSAFPTLCCQESSLGRQCVCPSGTSLSSSREPITSNGCGAADGISFNFLTNMAEQDCCNTHDICYSTLFVTKEQCDNTLLKCFNDVVSCYPCYNNVYSDKVVMICVFSQGSRSALISSIQVALSTWTAKDAFDVAQNLAGRCS